MMTEPVFWRLIWKEYRMLRSFWIALAVMTVLAELVVLAFGAGTVDERVAVLFGFGLAATAFYAVGCSATLFSTEHEEGTYEFLRSLPVAPVRLFLGKMALAVVSVVALLVVLWTASAVLAEWRMPTAAMHQGLWSLWGLAIVEAFVWGLFFSLVLRRPLLAVILGIAAASGGIHLLAWAANPTRIYGFDLQPYVAAVPYRMGLAALVFLADVWLARRWLQNVEIFATGSVPIAAGRRLLGMHDEASRDAAPSRRQILGRLLWHEWRESGRLLLTLVAVATVLSCLMVWVIIQTGWLQTPALVGAGTAIVFASLMGSCTFLADQERRRYRFFADHGERPRYVWLSRQLVWLPAVLALAVGAHLAWATLIIAQIIDQWWKAIDFTWGGFFWTYDTYLAELAMAGFSCGAMILAFSAGQLCSMLLRSGILAGVFGLVATTTLCGWAVLMAMLEVPWVWSVAPIPVVLLFTTWLRAPDWLLERNTPRAWLRVGLSLAIPATILVTAFPLYRVNQVPLVDPGISLDAFIEPASREALATADMYQKAFDLRVPWLQVNPDVPEDEQGMDQEEQSRRYFERVKKWVTASEESIALTLEASSRLACAPPAAPSAEKVFNDRLYGLENMLVMNASQLTWEGKLDEAFDRYMAVLRMAAQLRDRGGSRRQQVATRFETDLQRNLTSWAGHADQTPERLREAIERLDEYYVGLPPVTDVLTADYVLLRRIIDGDLDALAGLAARASAGEDERLVRRAVLWTTLMPWERARARRVLDAVTAVDLETLRWVEISMNQNEGVAHYVTRRFQRERHSSEPHRLLRTSRWFHDAYDLLGNGYRLGGVTRATRDIASRETLHRATRLQLALVAWKLEHGDYPEDFEPLIGTYFDELPRDPYSGQPFIYFPEGLTSQSPNDYFFSRLSIGTPFFVSRGSGDRRVVYWRSNEVGLPEFVTHGHNDMLSGADPRIFPLP